MKKVFLNLILVLFVTVFVTSCDEDSDPISSKTDTVAEDSRLTETDAQNQDDSIVGDRDSSVIPEITLVDTPEYNSDTLRIVDIRYKVALYPEWDITSSAVSIPNSIWLFDYDDSQETVIYEREYIWDYNSMLAGLKGANPLLKKNEDSEDIDILAFYDNGLYMIFEHEQQYYKFPIAENFTVRGNVIFGKFSADFLELEFEVEDTEFLGFDSLYLRIASITNNNLLIDSYDIEYGITEEGDEVKIFASMFRMNGVKYDADVSIADIPSLTMEELIDILLDPEWDWDLDSDFDMDLDSDFDWEDIDWDFGMHSNK